MSSQPVNLEQWVKERIPAGMEGESTPEYKKAHQKQHPQKYNCRSASFSFLCPTVFLQTYQVPPVILLNIALITNYFTLILYKCFNLRHSL